MPQADDPRRSNARQRLHDKRRLPRTVDADVDQRTVVPHVARIKVLIEPSAET
jgi:hypothetical protein